MLLDRSIDGGLGDMKARNGIVAFDETGNVRREEAGRDGGEP